MENQKLEERLTEIYECISKAPALLEKSNYTIDDAHRLSAINLIRYLLMRSMDLRDIHDYLSELGISALRNSESYVLHNVLSALRLVKSINNSDVPVPEHQDLIGYHEAQRIIKNKAKRLFNSENRDSKTEVMVTMPTEAAENPDLIHDLLHAGMEIARVNMSHDNHVIWDKMIRHVRAASVATQLPCKVYMDLPGPKIRTVALMDYQNYEKGYITRVSIGDELYLVRGETTVLDVSIQQRLSLTIPSILQDVSVGHRVLFDDGKISSIIREVHADYLKLEVVHVAKPDTKLKEEKGINFPDSDLKVPSLTEEDISYLSFASEAADMIGFSFVRTPEDIAILHKELAQYNNSELGIILKIETNEAFTNLPLLLLQAMSRPNVGVMIARGDLAVELGAERISEVQDQIMWICEAAHIPVIWATQVLETMAKSGIATRSEITDAAMGARAECVMLNKGPYINETVSLLKRILGRMEKHSNKKKNQMRALKMAEYSLDALKGK